MGAEKMIIDFHTHIFSTDLCRDRSIGLADGQFRCINSSEKARLISHPELMAAMKESGVDYCVAMGFPWEDEALCAAQNEYLRAVPGLSGGTIIPFGSVPVNRSTDCGAWVRAVKDMGLRGIGEVGFYREGLNGSTLDFLWELLAAARDSSLPLCLHVNEPVGHHYQGKYDPNLRELYALLTEYADVDIILSHWGGGLLFYELMPEVAVVLSRCYYDTAASPYIYSDKIYRVAPSLVSPKKILFGSDYPLIGSGKYIESISREILDNEWKADVLGMNAARLLKII